jgi:uncharacterized membrane protein
MPKVTRQLTVLLLVATLASSMVLLQPAAAANPPQPTYASARMNGDPTEWNLNVGGDFFSYMYRAGNPSFPVLSNVSLRYDCSTNTMYVLVMTAPGIPAIVSANDAWGAIGSVSNKVYTGNSGNGTSLPAFVWIGQGYDGNSTHAQGYEAAFSITPGTYTIIIHIRVLEGSTLATSATPGFPLNGIPLVIVCTANPSIAVTKMISDDNTTWIDANTPPGITVNAGSNVYYRFNVTNTGNATLSNVTLTDSLYPISPTLPSTLVPNVSYIYYYGPVTAQIGVHTNTANATGTFNNTKYSDTDDANYNGTVLPNPVIDLIKFISSDNATWIDANTPPGLTLPAGDNVYYKFEVTNIGNVELSNITLTDNTYSLPTTIPTTLAPNASFTVYLGPITALTGQQTNTATVNSQYNNVNYTESDDANYYGCEPALSLAKLVSADNATWVEANSPPGLLVLAGSNVYFQYIINNTGNVEITHLSLVDNVYTLSVVPPSSLAVGEAFSYYYGPVTALIGQQTNTATASGRCPSGIYYNATDTANYFGATPAIQVIKEISTDNSTWLNTNTPPGINVPTGSNVYFRFTITNTGNVELTNITLTDNLYPLTNLSLPASLAPDEVFIYYLGPIIAQDSQQTNTVTATGTFDNTTYSDYHNANYFGSNPQIKVIKQISSDNSTWIDADTPPGLEVYVGSNVYYRYVVNNTGNVELFNITLTDDAYSLGASPPMFLAANEIYTYYYGPIPAFLGQHTNTATATGQYYNDTYSDTNDANYNGSVEPQPAIDVIKQVSSDNSTWSDTTIDVLAGSNVYFRYIVNNTGNVDLSSLTLTDNTYSISPTLPTTLSHSQTYTYYFGPVTAQLGTHTNIATATGTYNQTVYNATESAAYNGLQLPNPAIKVIKQISTDNSTWIDADSPPGISVLAGSNLYYRFNVTNVGNVELTDITLTDTVYDLSGASVPSSLAPNASFVYYYGSVQAQEGQHTNTATATGKYNDTTYSDTNDANYNAIVKPCPSIRLIKWVSYDNVTWVDANTPPGLIVAAGSNIYFKFEITNTGNVALSSITLKDNTYNLSPISLPSTLAPNETFTCYLGPVTAQLCQHTNTATATGKYNNKIYMASDRANYYGTPPPNPCIDVTKYVSTNGFKWVDANSPPGLVVPANSNVYFKIIIKNTGNVPLSDITLQDSHYSDLLIDVSIPSILEPGKSFTIIIGPVQVASGQNFNNVTASGTYNTLTYSDSDAAFYYGAPPYRTLDYGGQTMSSLLSSFFNSFFGNPFGRYTSGAVYSYLWTNVANTRPFPFNINSGLTALITQ